jgi:hypothetical protein
MAPTHGIDPRLSQTAEHPRVLRQTGSLPAAAMDAIMIIMVRATVDQIEKDFPGYLHQVETGETVLVV